MELQFSLKITDDVAVEVYLDRRYPTFTPSSRRTINPHYLPHISLSNEQQGGEAYADKRWLGDDSAAGKCEAVWPSLQRPSRETVRRSDHRLTQFLFKLNMDIWIWIFCFVPAVKHHHRMHLYENRHPNKLKTRDEDDKVVHLTGHILTCLLHIFTML